MIEAGLFNLLSTTSAITAICQTRIEPDVFKTDQTYPAMTYKIIADKASPTLDTSGYQRLRVEFECRAGDVATATSLRAAVRQTLEGYRGILSDGTYLQDGQLVQLMNGYVDDPRLYLRTIEMYLFFNFTN